jgi:hypothetical protein
LHRLDSEPSSPHTRTGGRRTGCETEATAVNDAAHPGGLTPGRML